MLRSVAGIRTCATKSGRCGTCSNVVFGSSMGGPGHSAVDKLQPSQLQLLIRPVLVAAANTRMNRFVGWGGLAWAGSLVVDIMLLSSWTADLEYCAPHMRGSLDLMLQHGDNVTTSSGPIVKADVDAVAKVLSANYSAHAWLFTDLQLNAAITGFLQGSNDFMSDTEVLTLSKVGLKHLNATYDTVTAALKKKGFTKDMYTDGQERWSGSTKVTIASARPGTCMFPVIVFCHPLLLIPVIVFLQPFTVNVLLFSK